MANITESPDFNPVTRIEVTDTVGPGGNETNAPNRQFKQLVDRDKWLEQAIALLGLNNYPAQTIADVKELLAGDATAALSQATAQTLGLASVAQGRLTVVSGDPTPITDQTARTTLFYTPYNGNQVSLWNAGASRWDVYTFTERSLSLSGLTADQNYDVFLWDNAGTLTLQAVAWTSSGAGTSVRASAISQKDGVWVKTSDNRRYLGSFRTSGTTGQTTDSGSRRFIFNAQNQINRVVSISISSPVSWTYAGTAWRPLNNDANQASFATIIGLPTIAQLGFATASGGAGAYCGISENSTSAAPSSLIFEQTPTANAQSLNGFHAPVILSGYNIFYLMERTSGTTINMEGTSDQTVGIRGIILL